MKKRGNKKKNKFLLPPDNFGGKTDPRNKLNDLTGSGWQYWTKTVISTNYPSDIQHKLRSQHGGQKPPKLCADLIKVFTKKGEMVLDPLMGVGGSLLGAAICGRKAIGIDINQRWIDIYNEVCDLENIEKQQVYVGDCNKEIFKIDDESVDFVITDVPYWIMDKLKKTRSKVTRVSKLSSFNNKDLQSKEDWLKEMKEIFKNTKRVLKNHGYMAVFIGDLYRGKEYNILSADLARCISGIDSYVLKSDIIWVDNTKMLHIYGYPFAYIPSLIHQHILIFRKEDTCKKSLKSKNLKKRS